MCEVLIKSKIEYHLDAVTMTFFTKDISENLKNVNVGQVISVQKDNHVEHMIVTKIDEIGVWGVLYYKTLDVDQRRKQCQMTFFAM